VQLLPRGLFVTLEGGEGAGKSTLAAALAKWLRAQGFDTVLTQEPTGTPLGLDIWTIFQRSRPDHRQQVTPMAELLLMEAARAQHVQEVIRPALDRGDVVVCDRYADSTVAYQGHGRGLDLELVTALNEIATAGLEPDLTLLLDVPTEIGISRADGTRTGKEEDSIGTEALGFHELVRRGFLSISEAEPDRVVVIDATEPREVVLRAAIAHVELALETALAGI
jgi:dTMP kinase